MNNVVGHVIRAALLCLVLACATVQSQAAVNLTMDIAAQRRRCVGEAVQQCLVVRRDGDTAWTNFYDPIEGFTHEAGYRYRVLIERQVVPRPPADGSSFRYRLVRILSREREREQVPSFELGKPYCSGTCR